ncbi:MAG: right-handed parallel beta-helix repeat-containing protein [Methanothrix sp.]|uniref:right-handed parallel beta-helix repeat-containing protein n=1 Tax=Methanothrix sp. TaxID=90426 RepID=UPI0025D5C54F|nr:NosD domain-containing protein [Methanothrix sp.]MCQ8903796.1 right-handed parallel beta-helix repeat-containing protein [Methanothrix sp.]
MHRYALCLLMLLLIAPSHSETFVVTPGSSIQAAINSASSGDTIEIQGGTYQERIVVDKSLIIRGNTTSGYPEVNAGGSGTAVTISGDDVVIEGIRATGSGITSMDAGISVRGKNDRLIDCQVSGNRYGIALIFAEGCTLDGILAEASSEAGILLDNSTNNIIIRSRLENNIRGIRLVSSESNTIRGNSISNTTFEALSVERSSNRNLIEDNTIRFNQIGISLETSRGNNITRNLASNNSIGIRITNRNDTESIRPIENPGKYGGVSIKYKPNSDIESYDVRDKDLNAYTTNTIYNNTLINNEENAVDDGNNQWDNGAIGNHYSDFDEPEEGCRDRNRDGMCDSAHEIEGGMSTDRHPLSPKDPMKARFMSRKSGAYLGLDRMVFMPGERIDLRLSVPENLTAWIGILPASEPHGALDRTKAISYSNANSSVREMALEAPRIVGSYEIRMYSAEELVYLPISVEVPEVHIAPAEVKACEPINVTYSGAPGYEGDWIGIFSTGAGDRSPLSRKYLDGSTNGSFVLYTPSTPGTYNVRMFADDGYRLLAVSESVTVKPNAGVRIVAEPETVSPGQAIYVHFWGAMPDSVIGMYGVTRPDKFWINMQPTGGPSCGTLTFRAPYGGGNYDFRLFENNVYRKHMGASNVVRVV